MQGGQKQLFVHHRAAVVVSPLHPELACIAGGTVGSRDKLTRGEATWRMGEAQYFTALLPILHASLLLVNLLHAPTIPPATCMQATQEYQIQILRAH